ncbi:unnamed protein product [Vitrella brassicaformis CCMP3155]|uniref:Radical SAM core domain-containing protein n=3 Tax=Vitrella brassicaformis TaxID=1169539 RepID=A0A0G4GUB1_VITBC|nr:unnamed protein product [Vitrella brassicaformis CCMP3155]|eukprot:CEM34424.1 unnamed protein product [Vitrella brassicaformis CCMP3155]
MASTATTRRKSLHPLPILDETALLEAFSAEGVKERHAHTIWRHVVQQREALDSIHDKVNIPHKAHDIITTRFARTTSRVVERSDSSDGSTTKLLIELQDGRRIETVIMRYGHVQLRSFPEQLQLRRDDGSVEFRSSRRATVCISSQVGCQMGCTFCATGTMGLLSNLTSGEILEQLYHANGVERIRNVVFMGMGEPLDNYEEVLKAIRAMTDARRFNLSPTRISISTVGVVKRLRQLATDAPGVSLALSLHAPTQELRSVIVPTSKAWPLERILEATDHFIRSSKKLSSRYHKNQAVTMEYVLISGVNSSEETAHQLGKLLQPRKDDVCLNVIPYNPTDVPFDYQPPSASETEAFGSIVRSHGITVTVRQELGQDIASACGQLVVTREKDRADAPTSADIEQASVARSESRWHTTQFRRWMTPTRQLIKRERGVGALRWGVLGLSVACCAALAVGMVVMRQRRTVR